MEVKEYKVYKTASKTVKENNLILSDGMFDKKKRLFDFSLLNDMEISEKEKEIIKADAIQNVTEGNNVSFYGKTFDNFTACNRIADYYVQRVFSVGGKHLYSIFQLAKIEHNSMKRQSVYERQYNINTYKGFSNFVKPINDIEIA